MPLFKPREYQEQISELATKKLIEYKIVYLAMQVRIGKTVTSLLTAEKYGCGNVLFITKLKAISSIESDYKNFGFNFDLDVINYESLHKINKKYDLIICDEHHRNGAFPKPNKTVNQIKQIGIGLPMIFLSGTPTPESYSQFYHQFFVSSYSPFLEFSNFYKWANQFVNKKEKYVSYGKINDYSEAKYELINPILDKYILTYTQQEAGFISEIKETILEVEMSPMTYTLANRLKKDLIIEGKEEVILADTAVKLMMKLHQLYSGTIKFESGNSKIIDDTKGLYIKEKFNGIKIGIFYKFIEEYELLKKVFGDNLTNSLEEFNETGKNIALQIVSGREGISLKKAKYLVYFNIDFSSTSYWQSRDRMTTKDRLENEVFWVFAKNGIESKIYKAVMNKKTYTVKHFEKDVRKFDTKQDNKKV